MSETERKPLELGDRRPWGETTCHFGLTGPCCTEPATTHVMWLTDASTSNACETHLAHIRSRDTTATPYDTHPFAGDCGMPGALWHFPYEDEDGWCLFGAPDDASSLVEEVTPDPQTANPDPAVAAVRGEIATERTADV